MAATGSEVVLLYQLKSLYDSIKSSISSKVSKPSNGNGTSGQMLITNGDGTTAWANVPEGAAYSADDVTIQLTDTQFSVKDGGITAAKIADGTITAGKLASGVIPDVSGFITTATADEKYAAKTHTHADATTGAAGFMSAADKTKLDGLNNYVLPEATSTTLGGVKVATDGDAKAFLGY